VKGTKPVIGLAGGIASGKSLVAHILSELGAAVIDSDRLNHEVLSRKDVREQIQSWWGFDTYDCNRRCDRSKLAKIVFANPGQKKILEDLTYPLIAQRRRQLMRQYELDPAAQAIVLDSPLLYEAGLDELCEVVIFVHSDEKARLERASRSRGWKENELQRREKLQIPVDTKRNKADYIVENNSGIDAIRLKIESIFRQIMKSFSRPSST